MQSFDRRNCGLVKIVSVSHMRSGTGGFMFHNFMHWCSALSAHSTDDPIYIHHMHNIAHIEDERHYIFY